MMLIGELMGTLIQDVRFGVRMLAKNPGFTAVAVTTLALGIGANAAMISVVNAVLLRPLPYQNPGRLAVLWTDNLKQNLHQERTSYPNFEDWRKHSRAFEGMAFSSAFTVNLSAGDEPERVIAGRASANLFPVMGVKPILGRAFSSEEEERGERVVLLSYGLWQRRFGSSQDVLGKSLEIDGAAAVIIGVMPATFEIPARNTQLWEPLTLFPNWNTLKRQRNTPSGFVVGRLRPDFTFAQAQSDMASVARLLPAGTAPCCLGRLGVPAAGSARYFPSARSPDRQGRFDILVCAVFCDGHSFRTRARFEAFGDGPPAGPPACGSRPS